MNWVVGWVEISTRWWHSWKTWTHEKNQSATQCSYLSQWKQVNWQACKCEPVCVWQVVCHNQYTFMRYHRGSCTCDTTQWLQSTKPSFPDCPPLSLLFSPAIFLHHNKLSISLCHYPFSLSFSWKSKQALVEQPHSLAPLAGQLSHKTSWCYGNSHFTECAAQHWCKNRFNCCSKG